MKDNKKLYLGLEPRENKNIYHYPIIKIIPRPFEEIEKSFNAHHLWTHVLFTSRTSADLFFEIGKKKKMNSDYIYLVVGQRTKAKVKEWGDFEVIAASQECSEGILPLLEGFSGHLFFPHSSSSRPIIANYLKEKNINHSELILYDTIPHFTSPKPNLSEYEEIIFTSPSTVHAFLEIFGKLPKDKKLTAIGQVTQKTIDQFRSFL